MIIVLRPSTFAATLLAASLAAAPAAAQDPPAPTPPQVTCADWGSYRFFELASPDTVFACIAVGADPGAPVDMYRGTPLHHAARAVSDTILINLLLAGGADINARDRRGRTPLHEAARANLHPGVITALLAAGADVNARDLRGATPLHEAVRFNLERRTTSNPNPEVLTALLRGGADVDARDDRRNTPLHGAWINPPPEYAWRDPWVNAEAVSLLLAAGADPLARNQRGEAADPGVCRNWRLAMFALVAAPADYATCVEAGTDLNARDENGHTVLHHATLNTDTAIVHLLLEEGADPSVASYDNRTPLHFALRRRNNAVAAILVRAGADVNTVASDSITPLHLAASDEAMTTLLLEAGADVHAQALRGTALHRAETAGVVDALLDAGADIDALSFFGTPLRASIGGDSLSEVTRRLLERGADPNARKAGGLTPLRTATLTRPAVISALLDAGADPLLGDRTGNTLLHTLSRYSTSRGSVTIPLLLNVGVDINLPTNNGETPLHVAAGESRNSGNVALLLELGADPGLRTTEGDTPLHSAMSAFRPDSNSIATLVAAGADINARNESGRTPVQVAWQRGHTGVVDQLLALGADPVAGDEGGGPVDVACDWGDMRFFTAMPIASLRGCLEAGTPLDARGRFGDVLLTGLASSDSHGPGTLEMLAVFLEAGVDVNGRDDASRTPLHRVADAAFGWNGAGVVPFARALLDAGAEVNARGQRGQTPLHAAAGSDREGIGDSLVVLLAEAGADINARTETGTTPLHQAVNRPAIAAALLELGADRAAVDDSGYVADPVDCQNFVTRSFFALATPETVAGCIAKGANVNVAMSDPWSRFATGPYGPRPLHTVAESARDPATITVLLKAGAALHGRNEEDYTPLHHAAKNGTPAIVRSLLEVGAQVDMRASGYDVDWGWDWTPLHLAAENNPDEAVVRVLLEAGADVNARAYYGQTPLILAAGNANPAVATLLLEAGADVNAREWMGRTALHEAAASNGNLAMIDLLLNAGADLQAVGGYAEEYVRIYSPLDGVTPLHVAAAGNRNPAVLTALVRAGIEVDTGRPPGAAAVPIEHAGTFLTEIAIANITDPGHTSPLHLAATRNPNPAIIETLVALGADLELRDRDGRTALHMAARSNAHAFLALLALGADDTAVDDEGLTPWDYAKDNEALHGLPEVRRLREEEARGVR
ncbi:MAG: ankyrin repeat domain-containing protein [Gemmatimonadota bacterium]|nr:ankyrin repeat domain-containing protein [Gemmatimonadota bacterium]MDE2984864.1 ankyrin repeat domain-containing protein [Gemmatimonadota bacterium]